MGKQIHQNQLIKNIEPFSKMAEHFTIPPIEHRNFISSYLCQHLLFSIFQLDYFFNTCYPNGCEVISHCGFDLICISLTISDVEHLFLGLLTIYITFLEKAMATHSSTLAWKIPWTEEPGRLQSMGSLRVGHNWVTSLSLFTFMYWRRQWHPTPVLLPGKSHGRRSLVGCSPWRH